MLKRFLIFIVLLTGHASVAWSATDLHFGNYHALVIGNNDYGDLPKLKTAVNDAKSVAALLESSVPRTVPNPDLATGAPTHSGSASPGHLARESFPLQPLGVQGDLPSLVD